MTTLKHIAFFAAINACAILIPNAIVRIVCIDVLVIAYMTWILLKSRQPEP